MILVMEIIISGFLVPTLIWHFNKGIFDLLNRILQSDVFAKQEWYVKHLQVRITSYTWAWNHALFFNYRIIFYRI